MSLSHLPLFAPDEIRELTFRDERAEIVIKKLRAKHFVVVVRNGGTDFVGLMCCTQNPGMRATYDDIEECVIAAVDLSPSQRIYFDLN